MCCPAVRRAGSSGGRGSWSGAQFLVGPRHGLRGGLELRDRLVERADGAERLASQHVVEELHVEVLFEREHHVHGGKGREPGFVEVGIVGELLGVHEEASVLGEDLADGVGVHRPCMCRVVFDSSDAMLPVQWVRGSPPAVVRQDQKEGAFREPCDMGGLLPRVGVFPWFGCVFPDRGSSSGRGGAGRLFKLVSDNGPVPIPHSLQEISAMLEVPVLDQESASPEAAASQTSGSEKSALASVCVVGLGYVGLPVAVAFGRERLTVGFDLASKKVQRLREFNDATGEVSAEELRSASMLTVTDDPEQIRLADFVIIAVPTPVNAARQPDFSPLEGASRLVGKHMKAGAIVIYDSTVYPGTTEEVCVPILEKHS